MNSAEARKAIVSSLGEIFEPAGFAYKKSKEAFVRSSPHGRQFVFVGFWSYPPSYVFSMTAAVRVDVIEDVYNEIAGIPGINPKSTTSLNVQLWKLAGMTKPDADVPIPNSKAPFYYTICSVDDMARVQSSTASVARDLLFPFFSAYQDVAAVNRAINHEGLDTSSSRMLRGIIAAHLARDHDYAEIVARYRKEMEAWPPYDRELFSRVVETLSTRS